MSVSQSLLISSHDFEQFAPSWQAGVSGSQLLPKSFKGYDIESVNVVKTCEKLCLALRDERDSNRVISQELKDVDKQCAINKSNIPFRAYTNIWFGTLKIYRQQVNTLFRLSQDLLSRSCNYEVKHLEAIKRKSSVTSNKNIKKRRLTLNECTDKTYISTNYSKLLDDLEKLTKEPIPKSWDEPVSRTVTQLQIREITIREVSALTYTMADDVDEDSGFGEATHEEIEEFLNFFKDNSGNATKRKSNLENDSPIKQSRHYQDSVNLRSSPLKRSVTPCNFVELPENKFMEYDTPTNYLQHVATNNKDFIKIRTEHGPAIGSKKLQKKRKFNLIIDECTKIDTSVYLEEMKNNKISAKIARNRILKTYKTKKFIAALELLSRFNRRSLKLSLTLKQKIYLSKEQFQREYLYILRDIFKLNYNEEWASEIYPKWKCFKDVAIKQTKHKCSSTKLTTNVLKCLSEKPATVLNNLNDYLNSELMDDNAMCNIYQDMSISSMNCSNNSMNIHQITLKWHPYGVMMNLLYLWRCNETDQVAATRLFKLAETRFDRALGFYSLLDLFKKQFVTLTKFPETIYLQSIAMGKNIKCNL